MGTDPIIHARGATVGAIRAARRAGSHADNAAIAIAALMTAR